MMSCMTGGRMMLPCILVQSVHHVRVLVYIYLRIYLSTGPDLLCMYSVPTGAGSGTYSTPYVHGYRVHGGWCTEQVADPSVAGSRYVSPGTLISLCTLHDMCH